MPIYMKFEGIKGSATERGYVGWIELQSCQLGVHGAATGATGPAIQDKTPPLINEKIVITKFLDSSSADLFKASLLEQGKKVTIEFVKDGKSYMSLGLENTVVSSYSISGQGGGDPRPMETISLNCTKLSFKVKEAGASGDHP